MVRLLSLLFVSIGLPVLRFSGQLVDRSFVAATAVPVPIKWRRKCKTISPWLQLDDKSLAAATAVAVAVKYWRARTILSDAVY